MAEKERKYYKILKDDLTNMGMLSAPVMQYRFNAWNRPMESLSDDPMNGGGLYVTTNYKGYISVLRRTKKHQGLIIRIFICRIGNVLYKRSSRYKTDRLKFGPEDEILRMKVWRKEGNKSKSEL